MRYEGRKALDELDRIREKIGCAYCEDDKYEITAQTVIEIWYMLNVEEERRKRNIKLGQLLDYFGQCEPPEAEKIQIVFGDTNWNNFEQVSCVTKLLTPYVNCRITCIGVEKDITGKTSCLRVAIDEQTYHRGADD